MGVERDAEVAERAGAIIVIATLHIETPVVGAALPAALVEFTPVRVKLQLPGARRPAASVATVIHLAVAAEHLITVRRTLDHLGRVRRATAVHPVAETLGKRAGAALEEIEGADGLAGGACVVRDVVAVAHVSGSGRLD